MQSCKSPAGETILKTAFFGVYPASCPNVRPICRSNPATKAPASASAAPDACGGDRISPVRRRALRAQFRRQTIGSKKNCAFYAENHALVFIVYLLAIQKT